jgi:hypothetical protein
MDKFPDTHMVLRMNLEEIENLNRPITTSEIESVIKCLPSRMALGLNSTKYLKNNYQFSETSVKKLIWKESF